MVRISTSFVYTLECPPNVIYGNYASVAAPAAVTELAVVTIPKTGRYVILALLCPADALAAGAMIELQYRTSNDANTLDSYGATAAPTPMLLKTSSHTLTAGNLIRAINGTAGAAGSVYYVRIELVLIA